ncbi:hypothetical protein M752DRAFT_215622 [Aspergillus phoenicis ATCC 13157]|uniref:Uncharacterized protein n=1 Tax=Aspergillus phoenicis ATCC 13157 TaxID=1353007 RepID=A0A370PJP1_ASPPH|nr:hypothetical protein M752DRAFT_215622 [Aspergillus phoenicis ATCC 13157]
MTELSTNTMYSYPQAQFLCPKWQSFLTTRLSRTKDIPQYLDSALVSDCSHELLESDHPSDFIAGLVIRISLSPNTDLTEVHVDSSRVTLARLHNAIRGRGALEIERELIAILGYLISIAFEVWPAIAPAELMELAEACQSEAHIPQMSGLPDFLRAYMGSRCKGERHEVAYGLLLPSFISTSFFLTDVSVLATMAYPSIRRDNILRMWPIVHSISASLKILTTDWLWMIGPLSWGIHSLYGLLYQMDQQVSSPYISSYYDNFCATFQRFCTDLQGLAFENCASLDMYCTNDKQLSTLTLETARVVWPSLEMLKSHVFGLIYHHYQGHRECRALDETLAESTVDPQLLQKSVPSNDSADIENKVSAETWLNLPDISFSREEFRVIISYWVDWINHQRSRPMVRGKPEFWPESVRYTRSSKLKKEEAKLIFHHFLQSQPLEGLRSILNIESRRISNDLAKKLTGFINSQEFEMLDSQRKMSGDTLDRP